MKCIAVLAITGIITILTAPSAAAQTPIQIYGAWHCSNDYCTWGTVRDMTDFNNKNHWMIDRGDGRPSVNLVVLSFVQPEKLLNLTNDSQTVNGIPIGMNSDVVNYFTSHNVRVMLDWRHYLRKLLGPSSLREPQPTWNQRSQCGKKSGRRN